MLTCFFASLFDFLWVTCLSGSANQVSNPMVTGIPPALHWNMDDLFPIEYTVSFHHFSFLFMFMLKHTTKYECMDTSMSCCDSKTERKWSQGSYVTVGWAQSSSHSRPGSKYPVLRSQMTDQTTSQCLTHMFSWFHTSLAGFEMKAYGR